MTPKLPTIRTARRASTVKRRDVAAAAKAVILARYAATGQLLEGKSYRKAAGQKRK